MGYVGLEEDYYVSVKSVLDITAETGALTTQSRIRELTPADVVHVTHSRWIKTEDGAECEKCGREAVYQIVDDHWEYEPFCPHCGAIMDNKRGNEND